MKIKLTQGKFAIIDEQDYEVVMEYSWHYTHGYARTSINGRMVYMHRLITNAPEGMEVDHTNGNGLDNRQSNLRICTSAQNSLNSKMHKDNSSGVKGVYWDKQMSKWKVSISLNGKGKFIGLYDSIPEAKKAYDLATKMYYGEYRRLN